MLSVARSLSGQRRFLVALALAALVAAAAGLAVASRSGAADATDRPGIVATGSFGSMAWPTEGTAAIVRRPDGRVVLELRDFRTHPAPELWVYLVPFRAPGGGIAGGRKIDRLQRVSGAWTYSLPLEAASLAHPTIVVWCSLCKKPWAAAELLRAEDVRRG